MKDLGNEVDLGRTRTCFIGNNLPRISGYAKRAAPKYSLNKFKEYFEMAVAVNKRLNDAKIPTLNYLISLLCYNELFPKKPGS